MSAAAFRLPIRGWNRPPLEAYFATIHETFEALPISYSAELWCEPGRALCAEYASVLVRVEKRRGDELYINDGAYGALFDAAHIGWRYPVALVREPTSDVRPMNFSFYGPTCTFYRDSVQILCDEMNSFAWQPAAECHSDT